MITLEQFKSENNVTVLSFHQGKERPFARIGDKTVVMATKCDKAKPLFVVPITKDKNGNPLVNVFAICNSTVKHVFDL